MYFGLAPGVCRACFSNDSVQKHGRMVVEYRDQFVKDLNPDSSNGANFATSLGELISRLKSWKATLQSTIEDAMLPSLRLEDESRTLQVCLVLRSQPQELFHWPLSFNTPWGSKGGISIRLMFNPVILYAQAHRVSIEIYLCFRFLFNKCL